MARKTTTKTNHYEPLREAVLLPRDTIRPNPDQPRQNMDRHALAELSASIAEHGILQPILVRHDPSAYDGKPWMIVAGERRWRASEGVLDTIPCIISDADAETGQTLALLENIQRRDLLEIEEARGLADLMQAQQLSIRAAARALHVSQSWVTNRLDLLKTAPDVQAVAARTPMAMSSLLLIDKIKDDTDLRAELLDQVKHGASHAAVKAQVEEYRLQRELASQSRQAPDRETRERLATHERTGGGQMSRGRQLTGASAAEARQQSEHHLRQLREWTVYLSPRDRTAVVKRLRQLAEDLEE